MLTAFFRNFLILILVISGLPLFRSLAAAESQPLLQIEPSRVWLGNIYADTIIAQIRKTHPELKLTIDLTDLGLNEESFSFKQQLSLALSNFKELDAELSFKFIESAKLLFPPKLRELITQLEYGEQIEHDNKRDHDIYYLKTWIMDQPEHSIYPHELMAKAIELKNGHLLSAWILVWNISSYGWTSTANRNFDLLRSRFASLTGEQHLWQGGVAYVVVPTEERKQITSTVYHMDGTYEEVQSPGYLKLEVSKRGDEFSYLYHRVGVELLSMIISKLTGKSYIGLLVGKLGGLGESLKYPQTSGLSIENKKRINNDLVAADSGSRLYDIIANQKPLDPKAQPISPANYLQINNKKFGNKYQLTESKPAIYFGSNVDSKFWATAMSIEELTYRFHHAVRVDSEIFNPVFLASNGDYDRLHKGLVAYLEKGANDKTLNKYIEEYVSGNIAVPKDYNTALGDIDTTHDNFNLYFAKSLQKDFSYETISLQLIRLLRSVLLTAKKTSSVKVIISCQKVHLHR